MSSKNLDAFINSVEKLEFYQADYDIILKLLNNLEPKLFLKILEEVTNGNLYWYDFRELLFNTDYPDILNKELENQEKIHDYVRKLINLRTRINDDYTFSNSTSQLCLTEGYGENEKVEELYSEEMKRFRDSILYELLKVKSTDSILTVACKTKLFNAIKNGEILLKLENTEDSDMSDIEYSDEENQIIYTTRYTTEENNEITGTLTYDFINPDDIMLFLSNYIIPLDYEHQILDDFDKAYMAANKLNEAEMKQIKSLSLIMKKQSALNATESTETGDNDG